MDQVMACFAEFDGKRRVNGSRLAASIIVLAAFAGCRPANADDMNLSCLIEDAVSHAHRTLQIVFNERAQYVTVNGKTAVAGISDARIVFRVELSPGAPLDVVVERTSGSINISSPNAPAKTRVIYTGQCKAGGQEPV
jgi:hypothetical protein